MLTYNRRRRLFPYFLVLAIGSSSAVGSLGLAGISDFRIEDGTLDATADAGSDTPRPPDSAPSDSGIDANDANLADAPGDAPIDAARDAPVASPGLSVAALPGTGVGVGKTVSVTMTCRNDTGDPVPRVGARVTFTATGGTSAVTFGPVVDLGDGRYRADVTGVTEGTKLAVSAILDGAPLRTPPAILRVANPTTTGLTFSLDAANADGAGNFGGKGCPAAGRPVWTDLSASALPGTLTGFASPCGALSGWSGTGTPEDPARLTFDGVDDHVSFGAQNSLAKFTLVVWARKTGAGTVGNSGTGGLVDVFPILTKGTAEAENPLLDINYYLAIDDNNHIASDYEHAGTSTNAPLVGTGVLRDDTWHMLATTFDVTAGTRGNWVNGASDGVLAPVAAAALGPSSLLVLGGANRTTGAAVGRFKGDVAVVLTYDRALTAQELSTTCHAYSARFGVLACPN